MVGIVQRRFFLINSRVNFIPEIAPVLATNQVQSQPTPVCSLSFDARLPGPLQVSCPSVTLTKRLTSDLPDNGGNLLFRAYVLCQNLLGCFQHAVPKESGRIMPQTLPDV